MGDAAIKDEDFVDLFLLRHEPYKLLLVAAGNISNRDLEWLFQDNLEEIVKAFETYAQIGVLEVWPYDGQTFSVFRLEGDDYRAAGTSEVLSGIPTAQLLGFIQNSESLKRTAWLRQVREWVRQHI